jgi:hypothetical protein
MLLGMFLVCESVQIKTWRSQTNCVISGGACSPLAQQGTGTQCLVFKMEGCNNRCSRLKLQTFSRVMGCFSSLRFFAWSVVLQLVLLKMLQGVGHELEQISGTIVKLEHLLLHRSHYHLLQDESPPDANNRLSASELELLEVLLQVFFFLLEHL